MNLSNIRVHRVNGTHGLEAVVGFVVDDWMVVRDVKVICKSGRSRFLSMPQRVAFTRCLACALLTPADSDYCCRCGTKLRPKGPAGLLSVVHPATSEARAELTQRVLEFLDQSKEGGDHAVDDTGRG